MKNVKTNRAEVKQFVTDLFAGGKTPSERFGMTWDTLSSLEHQVPELTCKSENNKCKTA
ncbi:hypothetical protein AAGF18_19795 [Vibrio diabolicus]|uniref:hypothetical protein n=1 Tax=Vibrio diabolicus TaxID=50719 RepID=UPI0031CD9F73